MRKRRISNIQMILMVFVLMLLNFTVVKAEKTDVTIGSVYSTTQYFPLSVGKDYVYAEVVYDSERLTSLKKNCVIEKIAFHGAIRESGAVESFEVWLANSGLSTAPSSVSDVSAMTKIYSGSLTLEKFEDMGDVIVLELAEGFVYTGGSLHMVTKATGISGNSYFSYDKVDGACNFGYAEGSLYGSAYSAYLPVLNVTYSGGEESLTKTVTVGTSASMESSYYGAPVSMNSNHSISETIYTADELMMDGDSQLIKKLSYLGWTTAADNGEEFAITVWMGNTTAGKYDSETFSAVDREVMTKVFEGNITIPKAGTYDENEELMTLDLGEGFVYGGENLLVVVQCETANPKRVYWAYDSGKQNSSIYLCQDQWDEELTDERMLYTNGLPVTKFVYEPYDGVVPPFIDASDPIDQEPAIVLYTDKAVGEMLGLIVYTEDDAEGNPGGLLVDYGNGVLVERPYSGNLSLNDEIRGDAIKIYRSNPNSPILQFACFSMKLNKVELYESELTVLDLHDNNLTAIDLSNCPNLQGINLSSNKFFAFEYSSENLKELNLRKNELEQLLISDCTGLEALDVSINLLRSPIWIEMPATENLKYLDISYNLLSIFDLSEYSNLETLICNHNRFETLDLRNNTHLKELHAFYQGLTTLVLDANPDLEVLDVSGTMLTALDISMNKKLRDVNVSMTQISDLVINKCPDLEKLQISKCAFEDIDFSENKKLTYLDCSHNKIVNLDVAHNVALEYLDCTSNGIKTLDVSPLTNLATLICSNNKLTEINTASNTLLGYLNCSSNNLKDLTPTVNQDLYYLNCSNNNLSKMSVVDMINLVSLNVNSNQFAATELEQIIFELPDINGLEIAEEDLSWKGIMSFNNNPGTQETDTEVLMVKGWKHSYVEDLLGDASAMIVVPEHLINTRFTFSMQTGDETFDIDWGDGKLVSYTTNTYPGSFTTPEGVISGTMIKIYAPKTTLLATENNSVNAILTDNMPLLQVLTCSSNNIESVDVSNNPALIELLCGDNPLSAIKLPENCVLQKLNCSNTYIKDLDLSDMPELRELSLDGNRLTALDLSHSPKLTYLSAYDNEISTIDLSGCVDLEELYLSENELTELDLSTNTKLKVVSFTDNNVKKFDATPLADLEYLYVGKNGMDEIKLDNQFLVELLGGENNFESVDVSLCDDLSVLELSVCRLKTIDVSKNTNLDWLFVGGNKLETITFAENQSTLKLLHAEMNMLKEVDFARIPCVSELIVSYNQLQGEVDLTSCPLVSYVDLSHNQIEKLKLSDAASNLMSLYLSYNKLSVLSIPSESLGILDATRNNLAALDISKCNLIIALLLDFNNLNSLNLAGKNELLGLSIRQNKFTVNALNSIYENLPDVTENEVDPEYASWMKIINISGNPGAEESNTSVAVYKGWTIIDGEELPELRNLTINVKGMNGLPVEDATFTLLLDGSEFTILPTFADGGEYKFLDFEVFMSYDYVIRVSHPDFKPVETGVIDFTNEDVVVDVAFTTSGVDEVTGNEDVVVYGSDGHIVVKTAAMQTVEVYDLAGTLLKTVKADTVAEIDGLTPGIYIVRVGDRVSKVVVR